MNTKHIAIAFVGVAMFTLAMVTVGKAAEGGSGEVNSASQSAPVTSVQTAAIADAKPASAYIVALRTCGAKWRARTDKATNKGRDAWNTFRAECVKSEGYVSKRNPR